jgi:hypothetical protein
MPPDADPAMDRKRMRESGRRLADDYLRDPPLSAQRATFELAAGGAFTGEKALAVSEEFATDCLGTR